MVRFALRLIDGLLLAFFLAGYAARYLPPRYFWWTDLIAIGLPYLAVLVVLAGVGAALARRWRLLAVHLLALVLIAIRFLPPGLLQKQPEDSASDLTLITFNIPKWVGNEAEKVRGLELLARTYEPHLFAFQEVRVAYRPAAPHVRPASYLTTLIDSMHYALPSLNHIDRESTALPVLGRIELKQQTKIVLRPLDKDQDAPTEIVRTRFSWQGREAVHYNLHLRSFGDRKPWSDSSAHPLRLSTWRSYLRQYREAFLDRAWEARQVKEILKQEQLPFLVSGDFNSTPHSWAYWKLARDLQDAFFTAGRGWGATYHAELPFTRIDFILASPQWGIVEAEVPQVTFSDHRPLVARLQWHPGKGE